MERLREAPEWKEDVQETYKSFAEFFAEGVTDFSGKSEESLRTNLLVPALESLGFRCKEIKRATEDVEKPDYVLSAGKDGQAITAALTYCWNRNLDGPDESRDDHTPTENPSQVVVSLLKSGTHDWVIVTNGKIWRLYSRKAHSRATNYYEIDLEEVMALADPSDSFRYFYLFFRSQAFQPDGAPHLLRIQQAMTTLPKAGMHAFSGITKSPTSFSPWASTCLRATRTRKGWSSCLSTTSRSASAN